MKIQTAWVTIDTALVTQVFNNYNPTMYGGDGRHKGIDLGISAGNPVYACMQGKVIEADLLQTGYGRHIVLEHLDGSNSIYGHLTKMFVNEGDIVTAGQLIGKSGGDKYDGIDGDGFSTGAHLHWEIRPSIGLASDQSAVDPTGWCLQYVAGKRTEATVTAAVGLYVRATPITGTKLRVLYAREKVNIVEEANGWARIESIRPEWVSLAYLAKTGKEFTPIIPEFDDVVVPPVGEFTDAEKLAKLWEAHPELH